MFTTLRNAWKIPELRKKIIFTLIVMLIYRLGNCVPVPYVNVVALNNYFTQQLANTFSVFTMRCRALHSRRLPCLHSVFSPISTPPLSSSF